MTGMFLGISIRDVVCLCVGEERYCNLAASLSENANKGNEPKGPVKLHACHGPIRPR
jgi:hypothetical protein